ncbi:MAG: hypothetical protein ACK4KU_14690 [Acinetobacter sp.]|uniref:hypothetical protein n=1 Tax=Acinetobacter sp. TaxID=472 RepID=UPI00391A405E
MQKIAGFLSSTFSVSVEEATGWIQTFTAWIQSAANWLSENLTQALSFVAGYIKVAIGFWSTLLSAVYSLFTLDFAGFGQKMKDAFKLVSDFFYDNFGASIQLLTDNLKERMGWALSKAAYVFTDAIAKGINFVLDKLESALNGMVALINYIKPGDPLNLIDLGVVSGGTDPGNATSWMQNGGFVGAAPQFNAVTGSIDDELTSTLASLDDTLADLEATLPTGGGGKGGGGKVPAATKEIVEDIAVETAEAVSTQFMDYLKGSFSEALKTGNWKEFGLSLADRLTSGFIDQAASGLMDSLFGDTFDNIFENFGKSIANSLSSIFGGMSGGSGGLFGSALSFLGMATGGIVPHTPYSKLGQDSVPTMLTPGELVVPVGEVANFMNSGSGQTFNINITGDISRQTKKQIYEMLPEISRGVNGWNHETGNS